MCFVKKCSQKKTELSDCVGHLHCHHLFITSELYDDHLYFLYTLLHLCNKTIALLYKTTKDLVSSSWSSALTVSLLLQDNSTQQSGPSSISLCYEFYGRPGEVFALLSDACISVNAKYDDQNGPATDRTISSIGIIGIDTNSDCVHIEVNAVGCQVKVNNVSLYSSIQSNGISVMPTVDGLMVALPNCEFRDIEIAVKCGQSPVTGKERLQLTFTRMLNFQATSHGLIGMCSIASYI